MSELNSQEIEHAIDFFNGMLEANVTLGRRNGREEYVNTAQQSIDIAIQCMKKQLKDGWIPVSEKLPEKDGHYLVSTTNGMPRVMTGYYNSKRNRWDYFQLAVSITSVIAWKPLPQPYKKKILEDNEYQCAICQGIYTKTLTDEETMQQFKEEFPLGIPDENTLICDDCYQKYYGSEVQPMKEIIKKIDEMKMQAQRQIVKEAHDRLDEIANDISGGYIAACNDISKFISSQQKTPCYDQDNCEFKIDGYCEMGTPCPYQNKPFTIGEKIRESNESLAELLSKKFIVCQDCSNWYCGLPECRNRILDYLNQKYKG